MMVQHPFPWRQGTQVGRTVYDAMPMGEAGKPGRLIGLMDTPGLAALVVDAVNCRARLFAIASLQAKDTGLWFEPATVREAYLQQALIELLDAARFGGDQGAAQ